MRTNDFDHRASIRYQPDEKPPVALTIGLGLQLAILCIAGVVLTPAIVIRAAGASEGFLSWAVFAAVAVSGVTTVLQAVRVGRFGAGHVLLMGTSGAFIAVCVTALVQGGPRDARHPGAGIVVFPVHPLVPSFTAAADTDPGRGGKP